MIGELERVEEPGYHYRIDVGGNKDAFLLRLHTDVCELSFINAQALPFNYQKITLILEQQRGAHKVTWPANVSWPMKHIPILSNQKGEIDTIELVSYDGGNTWFGYFTGAGFKYTTSS